MQAVAGAQQLIGPQRADLGEVKRQLQAVAAALHYWLDKLESRVDKVCALGGNYYLHITAHMCWMLVAIKHLAPTCAAVHEVLVCGRP